MDIRAVFKQQESKLHRQLTAAAHGAIAAPHGDAKTAMLSGQKDGPAVPGGNGIMSAVVREKISRAATTRWAKIRAARAKKVM